MDKYPNVAARHYKAQNIISTFGVDTYGEPLFFPNAA